MRIARSLALWIAAILGLVACGRDDASTPPALPIREENAPLPPWHLADGSTLPTRRATSASLTVIDAHGKQRAYSLQEALALAAAAPLASGRHAGRPGVPLVALLGKNAGGAQVTVLAAGKSVLESRAVLLLQAPQRYILVANQRGMFKLLDMTTPQQVLARGVDEIRLARP